MFTKFLYYFNLVMAAFGISYFLFGAYFLHTGHWLQLVVGLMNAGAAYWIWAKTDGLRDP